MSKEKLKRNLGKFIKQHPLPTAFWDEPETLVITDRGEYLLEGRYSFNYKEDVIVNEEDIY